MKTSTETFNVVLKGVPLSVVADWSYERDMYGTGDSPDAYTVDILSIYEGDHDLTNLIKTSYYSDIVELIIEQLGEPSYE
jgi:hypothetical protein